MHFWLLKEHMIQIDDLIWSFLGMFNAVRDPFSLLGWCTKSCGKKEKCKSKTIKGKYSLASFI